MAMGIPQRVRLLLKFTAVFMSAALGSGRALAQLEGFSPPRAQAQISDFSPPRALEDVSSAPLQLRAGVTETDNALRTSTNAKYDTLVAAGLRGAYTRPGRMVDLKINSNLEWVDYLQGSYPSELTGFFDAAALFGKPTQVLQWLVRDTYSQLQGQPGAVTTPENLDRVNRAMTGPALNIRLPRTSRLTLYGLYARISSERSDLSANQMQGGFALVHALSPNTQASVNGTVDDFKYISSPEPNYTIRSAYVHLEGSGARTALTSDLGYTVLREGVTTEKGPLVRLDLARRISASSKVNFNLSQSFSASTASLETTESEPGARGVARRLALGDPYKWRSAALGWKTALPRTELSTDVFWSDEHYVLQKNFNRSYWGVDAAVSRHLRPDWVVSATARYEIEAYRASRNHDVNYSVDVEKALGVHLRVALALHRYHYHGSAMGSSFNENQIGLRLIYRLAAS